MSRRTQAEIDHFKKLDRKEREFTETKGKQCAWKFDTQEEADRFASDAWYLEDCNQIMFNGEIAYIQDHYGRSQLRVVKQDDKFCIVLPVKKRLVNEGNMAPCNLLGIPLLFE